MPTRPQMSSRDFEGAIADALREKLDLCVEPRWISFQPSKYPHYSPRVDVAVGPFATKERRHLTERYDKLLRKVNARKLLQPLIGAFRANLCDFNKRKRPDDFLQAPRDLDEFLQWSSETNPNSRCLIAVEIGRTGSRKHMLGDVVNASALGRVGLVVASYDLLDGFLGILYYWDYLKSKDKPNLSSRNVLVVTEDQLRQTLRI